MIKLFQKAVTRWRSSWDGDIAVAFIACIGAIVVTITDVAQWNTVPTLTVQLTYSITHYTYIINTYLLTYLRVCPGLGNTITAILGRTKINHSFKVKGRVTTVYYTHRPSQRALYWVFRMHQRAVFLSTKHFALKIVTLYWTLGPICLSLALVFGTITSAPSLSTFRKHLKLHLFPLSYSGLVL